MDSDGHEICKMREKRLQQKLNILQKAVLTSQETCSKLSFELRTAQQDRLKLIEQSTICQENYRQLEEDYGKIVSDNVRYKEKMKRYISHNVELRNRLGKLHEINEFLVKTLENYKNSGAKHVLDISEKHKQEDKIVVEKDKNIVNKDDKRSECLQEKSNNKMEVIRQEEVERYYRISVWESDSGKVTDLNDSHPGKITQEKCSDGSKVNILMNKTDIKFKLEKHLAAVLNKTRNCFKETNFKIESKESEKIPILLSPVEKIHETVGTKNFEKEQELAEIKVNGDDPEEDGRPSHNASCEDDLDDVREPTQAVPRIEIQDLSDDESMNSNAPDEGREGVSAEDESVTSADADVMKYITKNSSLGGKKMDRLCACPSKWCTHQLLKGCNIRSELV